MNIAIGVSVIMFIVVMMVVITLASCQNVKPSKRVVVNDFDGNQVATFNKCKIIRWGGNICVIANKTHYLFNNCYLVVGKIEKI